MIYWENALSGFLTSSMACINPDRSVGRHGLCLDCLATGDVVHLLGAWSEHPMAPACSLGRYFLPLPPGERRDGAVKWFPPGSYSDMCFPVVCRLSNALGSCGSSYVESSSSEKSLSSGTTFGGRVGDSESLSEAWLGLLGRDLCGRGTSTVMMLSVPRDVRNKPWF